MEKCATTTSPDKQQARPVREVELGNWWNQTTGADLPKISESDGIGSVTYENSDDVDYSHPQQEANNVARFVYRIAKFNPHLKVLNLTLRYTWKDSGEKKTP